LGYGSGLEAVTRSKAARLRRLGHRWLAEHDRIGSRLRFDVLAVHRHRRGPASIEHLRGAF
jgi:putative endonuclease